MPWLEMRVSDMWQDGRRVAWPAYFCSAQNIFENAKSFNPLYIILRLGGKGKFCIYKLGLWRAKLPVTFVIPKNTNAAERDCIGTEESAFS